MAAHDAARLWRGATLILQEAARLRAVDVSGRAKSLQHHVSDVARLVKQEAAAATSSQQTWQKQNATQQPFDSHELHKPHAATGETNYPAGRDMILDAASEAQPARTADGASTSSYVSAHASVGHAGPAARSVSESGASGEDAFSSSSTEAAFEGKEARSPLKAEYVEQVALAAGLRGATSAEQRAARSLDGVASHAAVGGSLFNAPSHQAARLAAASREPPTAAASSASPSYSAVPAAPAVPNAPAQGPSGATATTTAAVTTSTTQKDTESGAPLSLPASSATAPAAPSAAPADKPIRRKRTFKEVAVPASPLARVVGFGSLAASMAFGAAGEAVTRGLGLGGEQQPSSIAGGAVQLSEAQAERLAEGLCRMRGAALKIGQMLSLSDETMIPPAVAKVLERVRTQADVMPKKQLEKQMATELGPAWRAALGGPSFSDLPVAAASIGQVHKATLPDGRDVAIKVQYPGVAESINSDLNNLKRLLSVMNFLPKGLYLDSIIQVAREELTAECNYEREAECQERFRALVGDDPDFEVPSVVKELSTRRVLTTTWLRGVPIDAAVDSGLGPEGRTRIARKLLKLTLKELFEWRFMQTDPNWGNFFYDTDRDVIGLLDFGATRSFRKEFVDDYLRLVWAAANNDRSTILDVSIKLGFLTGHESKVMLDAHVDSGLVVGEPFRTHAPFDFRGSGMTARIAQHGATFAEHRLTPPPTEVYSLHRKLAGAFLICIRMGATMPCRDMLEQVYYNYKWGPDEQVSIPIGRA